MNQIHPITQYITQYVRDALKELGELLGNLLILLFNCGKVVFWIIAVMFLIDLFKFTFLR